MAEEGGSPVITRGVKVLTQVGCAIGVFHDRVFM